MHTQETCLLSLLHGTKPCALHHFTRCKSAFNASTASIVCRTRPTKSRDGTIDKWVGYLTDVHITVDTIAANYKARQMLSREADITLWSIDTNATFTLAEGKLCGVAVGTSNASLESAALEDGRKEKRERLIRNLPPA